MVLENLAYAYTRPNIMDVKLGTVLHAPYATDEKRQRMEKQARETTTHETGIRLTGCQVNLSLFPYPKRGSELTLGWEI